MRIQDIKIDEVYRIKQHPNYCYALALEIIRPKQYPNTHTYSIVKCVYSVSKDFKFGLTKYFRACDLVRDNNG